jgi:hypothetical protein
MPRDFFVDLTNRRLAASVSSLAPAFAPEFVVGDTQQVRFYFLEATGNVASPFIVRDKAASTLRVGIGKPTNLPKDGTYKVAFESITSGPIQYSATAGAISEALNGLSTMVAAGGCSVAGGVESSFLIRFNLTGAKSAVTALVADLIPATSCSIQNRVTGDSITAAVQSLRFTPLAYASQSSWTAVTGANANLSGSLSLESADLIDSLEQKDKERMTFEIQLTEADGISTVVSSECVVRKQLL